MVYLIKERSQATTGSGFGKLLMKVGKKNSNPKVETFGAFHFTVGVDTSSCASVCAYIRDVMQL
jgi:hypothetical protein